MIPHASVISESEVSIMALCLLCSPSYTAVRSKNCSKSTSLIKVAAVKNTIVPHTPIIVRNWSTLCPSLSAMFNSLHSSTNQEKHLCNQGSHHEKIWTIFVTQRKPSHATIKSTLFTVSKDEWITKQDTGKSLNNTLHILQYALGWSDIKQWKNQACSLSHYQIMLDWRHQSGSQLEEINSVK